MEEVKSVYIHIPFCSNICSYCDFPKRFYDKNLVDKYLDSLKKEIELNYKGELLDTLYIGGGTPSCLSINELTKLFEICSIFKLSSNYEFTFECNPENINEDKLQLLKDNKVNRLSIGIESTNDYILKYLNRNYTYKEVKDKVLLSSKYFDNINVDLMYAIKNESLETLNNDIDNILELPITHISTYSLIIEPHTVLYNNKTKSISEDLDYEMYKTICQRLKEKGFNHYEISNFSNNNYFSKHNINYWNNNQYYGFGCGSSGYIENIRYTNTYSIKDYISDNKRIEEENITNKSRISYALILGFRLISGINIKEFNTKYECDILSLYNIKELIENNLLCVKNNYIFIPYDKIYIENTILENFVD